MNKRRFYLPGVLFLLCATIVSNLFSAYTVMADPADDTSIDMKSTAAVLMEGSTGEILYEKNANEKLRPASITKIMTLLLIFEALDSGKISLSDQVSVSEHAASMGGSQVFLEPFETQDVDTMIKCISIASANDASVAMAEKIGGTEESFVAMMNQKAADLGMKNTNFVNCYGLDEENHYSSAMDVALMSRELIMKHPQISNYSTVWMDTFVHTTKRGETEFGLNNTNKLIKTFDGITGLKTGSTSLAKYCLSATAHRDDMDMVAVIMAAPSTKERFSEAAKLLNYGFANCSIYKDAGADLRIPMIPVKYGTVDQITLKPNGSFSYVCKNKVNKDDITKELRLPELLEAPFEQDIVCGEIVYFHSGKEIGSLPLYPEIAVEKAGFMDFFHKVLEEFL